MRQLSITYLDECFSADFNLGILVWNCRPEHHFKTSGICRMWNSRYSGKRAGSIVKRNSRYMCYQVEVENEAYLVHRILYAMYHRKWPNQDIGHKDGNPLNNAISNIEDISHKENMKYKKLRHTNKSGVNGVYWDKSGRVWRISLPKGYETKPYILQSKDFFEIVCARKSFEVVNDFHKKHGL